jgi:hypothetical protein
VTADALHTHPGAAEFLVTGKQAQYLFVVKADQPRLLDRTRDHAHGRVELRTLKAATGQPLACRCNSPSARCAAPGRSTSPPRCASTPATHTDPSPPLGSLSDDPTSRQNAGALRLT